ncbi:DUF3152 domain-containing protein [Haloactinomyces albus]|uniref:DUF3152 domain-containing protein n=1 Tax=Haloactinomyces albus TaxID=1352928 RepID=A0AAE3ZFN6_9ACTN|nr:DUF3152 domain-containing protein [Haloactinomyces albus]MDR7302885.1 hypothetical protein [Haloactinomyces albus]
MFAIPVMIVLSALATFQAAEPPRGNAGKPEASAGATRTKASTPPVVTEAPKGKSYDSELFSAELPPGAPIPKNGTGTFDVVPGTSSRVGSGELYRYTIEIEHGVTLTEGNDTFARLVQQTLSDPRSWTNPRGGGISLQRVDEEGPPPDFRVTLLSQNTARETCGYSSGLPYDSSCRIGERVYISAARWVRGAVSFDGDIGTYRRYAINHEVGHVFGNGHAACPEQGVLAPVMMQQTFSVANNELHRLNERVSQGTDIPANGLVCEPNAWPFPLGKHAE